MFQSVNTRDRGCILHNIYMMYTCCAARVSFLKYTMCRKQSIIRFWGRASRGREQQLQDTMYIYICITYVIFTVTAAT